MASVEKIWLKCIRDGFQRTGTMLELEDLGKIDECHGCRGHRYKCPQCGQIIKGKKVIVEITEAPKENTQKCL